MNYRTSLFLACILAGLLVGVYMVRSGGGGNVEQAEAKGNRAGAALPAADGGTSRPLFDEPPETVVKVECARPGQPVWTFERAAASDGGQSDWRITSPFEAKATKWMVDALVRQFSGLKYQARYDAQADGLTAETTGLDSPKYTVTLYDSTGKPFTVRVGRAVSNRETYVGVADSERVYLVQASLADALKKRIDEYRDHVLIDFKQDEANQMEFVQRDEDGTTTRYRLHKGELGKWYFETPFSAEADKETIDRFLRVYSKLRVAEWVDSTASPDDPRYGLTAPRTEVLVESRHVVAESNEDGSPDAEAESEGTDQSSSEKKPAERVETKTYRVLVSSFGPLSNKGRRYVAVPSTPGVATITKTTAEQFVVDEGKWRDMKVARVPLVQANKIVVEPADEPAFTLVRLDDGWVFDHTTNQVHAENVRELLSVLDAMRAVAFVDGFDPADSAYGLDRPTARITLTLPGRSEPARFTIGGPTDAVSKLLYYVRYGESSSLAKVRVGDIEPVFRTRRDYQSRDIISLDQDDLDSLDLTRANWVTEKPESLTIQRGDDGLWRLVSPIDSPGNRETINALVSTVTQLKASRVEALSGEPSQYGLDDPSVQVVVSHKVRAVGGADPNRTATSQAGDGAAAESATEESPGEASPNDSKAKSGSDAPNKSSDTGDEPSEKEPAAKTELKMFVLKIKDNGLAVYAQRSDSPVVYRLDRDTYSAFTAEFGPKDFWEFGDAEVMSVSVDRQGPSLAFERRGQDWVFSAEPDLPIDKAKVDELINHARTLVVDRFVAYHVADPGAFGLDAPWGRVTLTMDDGRSVTLLYTDAPCAAVKKNRHCAMVEGGSDVFTLTTNALKPLNVSIKDFEKKAAGS